MAFLPVESAAKQRGGNNELAAMEESLNGNSSSTVVEL